MNRRELLYSGSAVLIGGSVVGGINILNSYDSDHIDTPEGISQINKHIDKPLTGGRSSYQRRIEVEDGETTVFTSLSETNEELPDHNEVDSFLDKIDFSKSVLIAAEYGASPESTLGLSKITKHNGVMTFHIDVDYPSSGKDVLRIHALLVSISGISQPNNLEYKSKFNKN